MPRPRKKPQIYVKFTIGMKNPPKEVNIISEGFTMGIEKEVSLSAMISSFALEVIDAHCRLVSNDFTIDEINQQIKKAAWTVAKMYVAKKEASSDGQ